MNPYENLTNGTLVYLLRDGADGKKIEKGVLLEAARRLVALTSERQAAVNEVLNTVERDLRKWAAK